MIRAVLLNSPLTYYDDRDFFAFQNDFYKSWWVVSKTIDFSDVKVEVTTDWKIKINKWIFYMPIVVDWFFREENNTFIKENYPEPRKQILRVEITEEIILDAPTSDGVYYVWFSFNNDEPNNELGSNVVTAWIFDISVDTTNKFFVAKIDKTWANLTIVEDLRQKIKLKWIHFDPEDWHTHDWNDSPKINSKNVIFDKTGSGLGSENVEAAIKELDDKKSDKWHTHKLEDITDVTVTSEELNRNLPTNEQKDALEGAWIPSASNPYATKDYVDSAIISWLNQTSFNNIFSRDDKTIYVADCKRKKIDYLQYSDTNVTYWEYAFSTFFDDFQEYRNNVINVFDAVDTENWNNGTWNTSDFIYEMSRELNLWVDTTWTLFVTKSVSIPFDDFKIYFAVYIEDKNNVDECNLQMKTDDTNYFTADFLDKVGTWWNIVELYKSDFIAVWNPDWNNINTIRFEFSTNTSWWCVFRVDVMRAHKLDIFNWVWTNDKWVTFLKDWTEEYLAFISEGAEPMIYLIPTNQWRKFKDFVLNLVIKPYYKLTEINIYTRRNSWTGYHIIIYNLTQLIVKKHTSTWVIDLLDIPLVSPLTMWEDNYISVTQIWDSLKIEIKWEVYEVVDWEIQQEWIIKFHWGYNWIWYLKNVEIIKQTITETENIDGKLIRVDTRKWIGDKFEFPKNRYIFITDWSTFWWVEEEWILNKKALLWNWIYSKQVEKDLFHYKYWFSWANNDVFYVIYNVISEPTSLYIRYKTDDSNYFEISLDKTIWTHIFTIQRWNINQVWNPDWSNIKIVEIENNWGEIEFEWSYVTTAIQPLSEIYNVVWTIWFVDYEGWLNDIVFLEDDAYFEPADTEFIVNDWILEAVITDWVKITFRENSWNWYFIEFVNWNLRFGKKNNVWVEYIGDWAFVNSKRITIKVVFSWNKFKYYYSIDWQTFIFVDEVIDNDFVEWSINISGKFGSKIREYLYMNELEWADLYTILLYEDDQLIWIIERP